MSDSTCATCGAPAGALVRLTIRGVAYEKELCRDHLDELVDGARIVRSSPMDARKKRPRHAVKVWAGPHAVARSREGRPQA